MKRWLMHWQRPDWAHELDFVGPRVRTAAWAWGCLLAGILAAAWVWPQVVQVDADLADAQQTLKRLQRAAHQQVLALQAPAVSASRAGQADQAPGLTPESAQRAAQLAQWLGYPWMTVIERVESAGQAEQVVMLSFSLDIGTLGSRADSAPDVRVTAAVRDDASALRWAQTQGPSAQLLSRERLSTSFATASGAYDWRAEASWTGGAP